jgi:molybdopterin molybdotransferase
MLSLEEAQARVLAHVQPQPIESVPLRDAAGRFLVESPIAQVDLPGFDNSAMDGYAVRCEDLIGARRDSPVTLRIIGKVPAGKPPRGLVLTAGTCCRVFTGSMLPQGANAVLMQEDTRCETPGMLECLDSTRPLEHIRLKGEDIQKGTTVFAPGLKLGAGGIAVCAAAGIFSVKCGGRPLVGFLATGDELAESGPLSDGEIYESNRSTLAVLARQAGARVKTYPIVPDSLEETRRALQIAFHECDFVVTSGGVSVGELDYVKPAFELCGGKLDFWRISIKPGKPFAYGTLANKLLFGLPGNPVSAFVTFLLLVRPALLRAQGAADAGLRSISARSAERFTNAGDRRHFLRVAMNNQEVFSAGIQASHMLLSLSAAQGLLDVPPNSTIEPGRTVSVLLWD